MMYGRNWAQRLKRMRDAVFNSNSPSRHEDMACFYQGFINALAAGEIDPLQIPLRALFEELVLDAAGFIKAWESKSHISKYYNQMEDHRLVAFQTIVGCAFYAIAIGKKSIYPLSSVVETIPHRFSFGIGSIPGIPGFGLSEEWIQSPEIAGKRSETVSLHAVDILNSTDNDNVAWDGLTVMVREAASRILSDKENRLRKLLTSTEQGKWYATRPDGPLSQDEINTIKSTVFYLENWPLTNVSAPLCGVDQDGTAVAVFKFSERGGAVLVDSDYGRQCLSRHYCVEVQP